MLFLGANRSKLFIRLIYYLYHPISLLKSDTCPSICKVYQFQTYECEIQGSRELSVSRCNKIFFITMLPLWFFKSVFFFVYLFINYYLFFNGTCSKCFVKMEQLHRLEASNHVLYTLAYPFFLLAKKL